VISARRIASTVLAVTVVAVAAASRPAVAAAGHGHGPHGCQAAAPGGRFATLETATVAGAVHHAASAPGVSGRASRLSTPAAHGVSPLAAGTFARPHDPQHLHAFSLLI
jgi:hypothetical protein